MNKYKAFGIGHTSNPCRQLEDNKSSGRLAEIEGQYDCDAVKREAFNNAAQAMEAHVIKTRAFDQETTLAGDNESEPPVSKRGTGHKGQERPQPSIFQGTLKQYQLKGNFEVVRLAEEIHGSDAFFWHASFDTLFVF